MAKDQDRKLTAWNEWSLWQFYLLIDEGLFDAQKIIDILNSGKVRSEEWLKQDILKIKRKLINNGRKRAGKGEI